MSAKAIREFDGKSLLFAHLSLPSRLLQIDLSSSSSPRGENPGALLEAKFAAAEERHGTWLTAPGARLVVKPDQLIKRRGKHRLVLLDATWPAVKAWIAERAGQEATIGGVTGKLTCFVVEPFVEHQADDEAYVCVRGKREGDEVLYCPQGGVDVGDVEAKARRSLIPIDAKEADAAVLASELGCSETLAAFIARLHAVFAVCHFTYLEINPLVVVVGSPADGSRTSAFHILDLAAKLDQTAEFEAHAAWRLAGHPVAFPPPFGRDAYPEEAYIGELDGRTGASLKLTILNPNGRIWTMVAGGGASVAYTDAIVNCLGPEKAGELANYGEYSGAPTETQTYDYARTILDLMTRHAAPVLLDTNPASASGFASTSLEQGDREKQQQQSDKILFIGGGIANFTNVATTFRGIIRALRQYAPLLRASTRIYVRRGGPNWHEGLRAMREVGEELGLRMSVFGPETHITAIVPMALSAKSVDGTSSILPTPPIPSVDSASNLLEQLLLNTPAAAAGGANRSGSRSVSPGPHRALFSAKPKASIRDGDAMDGSVRLFPSSTTTTTTAAAAATPEMQASTNSKPGTAAQDSLPLLTSKTRCFVWGMQPKAVQGMLDFDYISRRSVPSVAAMIYPFGGEHQQKFYWGTSEETLVPVYAGLKEAVERHPEVDTLVNFASCRSVLETCTEALSIRDGETGRCRLGTIAVIAEGVPERHARQLGKLASEHGAVVIGPATVGGVRAGAFRIGNTGGMIDNLLGARLYRPGSVSYVSRSGGMSNELNNVIARVTDGVCEGIAIGGDRFPGSGFLPHVLRFEADPQCHLVVLLGEVGGGEEYAVADAIRQGLVTKPVVAWCIGVCAEVLAAEGGVQFGHAGAMAEGCSETASAKMDALRQAGAIVPATFEDLPSVLRSVFDGLVEQGRIVAAPEPLLPTIPVDYAWAAELGLIRRPAASFVSTICDDRGQELLYAGMPISRVFEEDIGVGGVLGLLWFRRRLPAYACRFIEMVLMLTADHGPAVSGAHNCIVTARAGRDLPSALCSGLLTIGDRFGGASDGAAEQFSAAFDAGMAPEEFVKDMRRQHKLIMGIGHRIKSVANPDRRVTLLVEHARQHFPTTPLLEYARAVERVTTAKKDTLILNVDGAIGVLFVDLLRHSGAFTPAEAEEYVRIGTLSGLFVLGRSIGFIGHYLDQRRLKQGLYRHPWDDISYLMPTLNQSRP